MSSCRHRKRNFHTRTRFDSHFSQIDVSALCVSLRYLKIVISWNGTLASNNKKICDARHSSLLHSLMQQMLLNESTILDVLVLCFFNPSFASNVRSTFLNFESGCWVCLLNDVKSLSIIYFRMVKLRVCTAKDKLNYQSLALFRW